MEFNQLNDSLKIVLETHSKKIEKEKLKALGSRNLLYEEVDSRDKKKRELALMIKEKKEELERLYQENNNLNQLIQEQHTTIEKLANNEHN